MILRKGVGETWSLASSAWDIMLRTGIIYLVILVGLRLAEKREIGQIAVFDRWYWL